MNRDALAFLRILPAGAADIGPEVTREELREAGVGDWVVTGGMVDDVGCLFPEFGPEYDVVLPMDAAPARVERAVQVRFKDVG